MPLSLTFPIVHSSSSPPFSCFPSFRCSPRCDLRVATPEITAVVVFGSAAQLQCRRRRESRHLGLTNVHLAGCGLRRLCRRRLGFRSISPPNLVQAAATPFPLRPVSAVPSLLFPLNEKRIKARRVWRPRPFSPRVYVVVACSTCRSPDSRLQLRDGGLDGGRLYCSGGLGGLHKRRPNRRG